MTNKRPNPDDFDAIQSHSLYQNSDAMNTTDKEIQEKIDFLSAGELTLEEVQLISKFGRVKSFTPFTIEFDFTSVNRILTKDEYIRYNAIMNKLSGAVPIKPQQPDGCELDTQDGFVDFFSQYVPTTAPAVVKADTNLVYGNENAPAMPNTSYFDLFFRALTSPQHIGSGHISNSHEKITVTKTENAITIKRDIKGKGGRVEESQIIKMSNFNLKKRNKNTILIFCYLFQTLAQTPGANCAYMSYKELVDVGIYDTVDGARRGINNFYEFFYGGGTTPGVSISGKFKTSQRKSHQQKERVLITGRDVEEGGQVIYLNPDLNLSIFTAYTSFLPLWSYRLENLDAFLLVRYIFFTARMKGGSFETPDRADQNPKHNYKYFTLTFDSVRDALGLPAPADVTGRKYKERIKDPIEKAIEDIELVIAQINDPEKSILVTLTPQGTDDAANIAEYLRCKLEIGIVDTFANSFIEAARKHEKHVTDFKKKIEEHKARNIAKSVTNQTTD